jgi:hypothetical protein
LNRALFEGLARIREDDDVSVGNCDSGIQSLGLASLLGVAY